MSIALFKNLIVTINIPRILPHLLLYSLGVGGGHFKDDLLRNAGQWHLKGAMWYTFLYLLVFDKTFRNIFYFRIGKLRYWVSWLLPPHNSFVIQTYSVIGAGFLGVHPIGTTINAESIGFGFTCRNNTVIGVGTGGRPSIGDNVDVGTNSVIIGGISVGNNVKIGAGTILTKSVPDNCVVVGNPAFILKQNNIRVNKAL